MALTDARIKNAKKKKKPYKLADANGLHVEVRPTGAKLWRYRYRIGAKENVFAIGEYCQLPDYETPDAAARRKSSRRYSLAEAREERAAARDLVKQGMHPVMHRAALNASRMAEAGNTFEVVAREWLEKNRPHWSPKNHHAIERTLEADVFRHVGALPIRQVSAAMILGILDRVDKRGAPVVAINIRHWCSGIFAHAVRTLRADGDPTFVLKGHIKRPEVKHKTPLTKDGIRNLATKIEGMGYVTTRFALNLLLYLFVRPGELRQAEWSEFDLERAVWTIPAEKMKKREKHLVPLSTQAVELLRALQKIAGHRRHLFPNHHRPNDCMSQNALNQALRRLGYAGQFTAHGFRATASTELHELGYRSEIIEFQLAHAERDQSKASYNHAQYWNERKAMMQQWADLVDAWSRGDNVVSMSGKPA